MRISTKIIIKRFPTAFRVIWIVLAFLMVILIYFSTRPIRNDFAYTSLHLENVKKAAATNSTWHTLSNADNEIKGYFHQVYVDNRNEDIVLRTFIVTKGYLGLLDIFVRIYCQIWYPNQTYPLVIKACVKNIEISKYYVDGQHYSQYAAFCSLPNASIPQFVSLTLDKEYGQASNLLRPHQPQKNNKEEYADKRDHVRSIGVCLSAQFGSVTDATTPLLIQWMEGLRLFGVHAVIMYNATMQDVGARQHYSKALRHYESQAILKVIQIGLPFQNIESHPSHTEEYHRAEAIRMLATNDCLYRNMFKYDFILHIDRDELIVPLKFTTYQLFLNDYFKRNPGAKDLTSLSIPSAFFYTFLPSENISKADIYLLTHHTLRTPVETHRGKAPGFAKSFNNPKYCVNMWSHRCSYFNERFVYADSQDVLVHHYRSSCRVLERCDTEIKRTLSDTSLADKYGRFIDKNTQIVLNQIGYHS